MHVAIVGSGAVGGYFGAKLSRAGQRVSFIARGAHLGAIRERGLQIRSPLGDFTVHGEAEDDPSRVGPVDVVMYAVKTYDNPTAVPLIDALVADRTVVLTLQNGVDSADEIAARVGRGKVLAGSAYVATALAAPGVIEQTGSHRRIVFGEVFGEPPRLSDRVLALREALVKADIQAESVPDARVAVWEKFCFLAPFAAFSGGSRLPLGPLWQDAFTRSQFHAAVAEVVAVARAEGVDLPHDMEDRTRGYVDALPGRTRASLLIDLSQGKRIEVEALQGAVVRRGARAGVPTPIMAALYAVLKPHADGPPAT
ncbi:MAG TPA: 2-dehydropantoate 2-reductase [Vicinamibacterales bacterium]|nr:2-dehydropantoate 2-reductase [Vicinamibacterales bacterium]